MNGQHLNKSTTVRLLALGDSYTIGESVKDTERWPVQLIKALQEKGYRCIEPEIVAVTGWRTDELKRGIADRNLSSHFNLVSLLIGVNNQYQGRSITEYEEEFEDLLNIAVQYAGNDPANVFVLSIPDYGFTPFGKDRQQKISGEIDAFNQVNRRITESKGAKWINITDISRKGLKDPELVATDGLHPSGKMYKLWVERILQTLLGD